MFQGQACEVLMLISFRNAENKFGKLPVNGEHTFSK
jgi:hypothetical protein